MSATLTLFMFRAGVVALVTTRPSPLNVMLLAGSSVPALLLETLTVAAPGLAALAMTLGAAVNDFAAAH